MNKENNNAIISLVLGILSIMIPLIGLILGIIGLIFANKALNKTSNISEGNKKYAVAGKVCSIVGICIHGAWILFAVISFIGYTSIEVY